MANALTAALKQRQKADKAVSAALKKLYPENARITWSRHGIHSGVVVMLPDYSYDRVKVRNERTGKEFWIYAHDILES